MIHLENCGKYIDREVALGSCNSWECLFSASVLSDSVLMVVFTNKYDAVQLEGLFMGVLRAAPLAISVYGVSAELAFNMLVEMLGKADASKHVMTKLIHAETVSDAVEQFFWASWPADERFDEWKRYAILVSGEGGQADIEAILNKYCSQ